MNSIPNAFVAFIIYTGFAIKECQTNQSILQIADKMLQLRDVLSLENHYWIPWPSVKSQSLTHNVLTELFPGLLYVTALIVVDLGPGGIKKNRV